MATLIIGGNGLVGTRLVSHLCGMGGGSDQLQRT